MEKHQSVNDFLKHLDENQCEQVQALRKIILMAEPGLVEHIKWNAPSYVFEGEDRLTFNLMNKARLVMLVFHMGVSRPENKKAQPIMEDRSGLMIWNSDIRGTLTFKDLEEIHSKQEILIGLIRNWLSIH